MASTILRRKKLPENVVPYSVFLKKLKRKEFAKVTGAARKKERR